MSAFDLYLKATENEICIDKRCLNDINWPSAFSIIRPWDLTEKIKLPKGLFIPLYILFSFFWFILGNFLFASLQFLRHLPKINGNQNPKGKALALGKSHILFTSLRKFKITQYDSFVGHVKDDDKTFFNDKKEFILENEFSVGILLKSYFRSILFPLYFLLRGKNIIDSVQSYTSFEWFVFYEVMMNVRGNYDSVIMANHYDRWAILIDGVFIEQELVILQHGKISLETSLGLNKLKNINKVMCFDEASKEVFEKNILDVSPTFEIKKPLINLEDFSIDHFKLLIIGEPNGTENENYIMEHLESYGEKITVFVKPHPLFQRNHLKFSNNEIITRKDCFPKVDLVLVKGSTLGVEYENVDIEVYWMKDDINEVLDYVAKKIS